MVHWDDVKANMKEVASDLKRQKIGIIGISLIVLMVSIGLLAPVLAPGAGEEWSPMYDRWDANPERAPPKWFDYITTTDYAHHHVEEDFDYDLTYDRERGREKAELTFTQEIDADVPPQDFFFKIEGEVEELNQVRYTVERPEPDWFRFSLDRAEYEDYFEDGRIVPPELRQAFIENGRALQTQEQVPVILEVGYEQYLEEGPIEQALREAIEEELSTPVTTYELLDDTTLEEDNGEWIIKQVNEETHRIEIEEEDLVIIEEGEEVGTLLRTGYEQYFEEAGEIPEQLRQSVNAYLEHGIPEGAELTRGEELFSLDLDEYEQYLEEGLIHQNLREAFVEQGFTLPENTNLTEENGEWEVFDADEDETLYRIDVGEDELIIRPELEVWFSYGEREHEEFRFEIGDRGIEIYRHNYVEVTSTPNQGAFSDEDGEFFIEGDNRFEEFRIVIEDDRIDVYHYPADRSAHDFDKWVVHSDSNPGMTGEFRLWDTLRRRGAFRDIAREKGRVYLRTYEGVPDLEIPDRHDIGNPVYVLQSQLNKNMLNEAELDVLRGEYTLNVELWGARMSREEFDAGGSTFEIDEDATSVTFSGAVFGLMGTDRFRRDLWQGWVHGARWGLLAGGIVAVSTIVLSTLYGMTSAYYGGWVDELMSRINEIMIGIPTLPLLIIILLYWQSIWAFIILYAALMWRGAARVIRARGLQVAQDTYIEASEALGSGSGRIIRKHMIPQILPYSFAQASLLIPVVIMAEAGLHILGLGDPGIVSWGTILNEARAEGALLNPSRSWWWVLLPGLGMVMVGFGFIATGMAIERIINPKMQQR